MAVRLPFVGCVLRFGALIELTASTPAYLPGDLQFIDTDDMQILNYQEHTNCNAIVWDPTGRYCVTVVSRYSQAMDTGYIVWTFQGNALQKHVIDNFFSLQWRPRPPSLLNKADIKVRERERARKVIAYCYTHCDAL